MGNSKSRIIRTNQSNRNLFKQGNEESNSNANSSKQDLNIRRVDSGLSSSDRDSSTNGTSSVHYQQISTNFALTYDPRHDSDTMARNNSSIGLTGFRRSNVAAEGVSPNTPSSPTNTKKKGSKEIRKLSAPAGLSPNNTVIQTTFGDGVPYVEPLQLDKVQFTNGGSIKVANSARKSATLKKLFSKKDTLTLNSARKQKSKRNDSMIPTADQQIKPSVNHFNLVILGTGESGKTTLYKQIARIFNKTHFREEFMERCNQVIRTNVATMLLKLIEEKENYFPDAPFSFPDKIVYLKTTFPDTMSLYAPTSFSEDVIDCMVSLWDKETVLKKVYAHRGEFNFPVEDFPKLVKVLQTNKSPDTSFDEKLMLQTYVKTSGYTTFEFDYAGVHFSIFDTGGQRIERRKWDLLFQKFPVSGILYVASLSEFDLKCYEDIYTYRTAESLSVFKKVVSTFPINIPVYLFFTKRDILLRKMDAPDFKMEIFDDDPLFQEICNIKDKRANAYFSQMNLQHFRNNFMEYQVEVALARTPVKNPFILTQRTGGNNNLVRSLLKNVALLRRILDFLDLKTILGIKCSNYYIFQVINNYETYWKKMFIKSLFKCRVPVNNDFQIISICKFFYQFYQPLSMKKSDKHLHRNEFEVACERSREHLKRYKKLTNKGDIELFERNASVARGEVRVERIDLKLLNDIEIIESGPTKAELEEQERKKKLETILKNSCNPCNYYVERFLMEVGAFMRRRQVKSSICVCNCTERSEVEEPLKALIDDLVRTKDFFNYATSLQQ